VCACIVLFQRARAIKARRPRPQVCPSICCALTLLALYSQSCFAIIEFGRRRDDDEEDHRSKRRQLESDHDVRPLFACFLFLFSSINLCLALGSLGFLYLCGCLETKHKPVIVAKVSVGEEKKGIYFKSTNNMTNPTSKSSLNKYHFLRGLYCLQPSFCCVACGCGYACGLGG
jgi:hypothetical protein